MKNRFGVDTTYFRRLFDRKLKNLADYTPAELARVLARMSMTADDSVLLEKEFSDEGVKVACDRIKELETQIEMNAKGRKVAYELLDEISRKAGVKAGDVAGLIGWIGKLPEPD